MSSASSARSSASSSASSPSTSGISSPASAASSLFFLAASLGRRRRGGCRGRRRRRRCGRAAPAPDLHEVLAIMLAPALRALDRAFVQVVETRAAALAGALSTPVRLDHAGTPGKFRKNRPNGPRGRAYVTRLSPCQNQIPACYEDAAPHFRRPSRRLPCPPELPAKLVARPVARLKGRVRAPGDKSVSHRALMFGALALGETTVRGLLEGEDVLCTAAALRALGAEVVHEAGRPGSSGGSAASAWAAAASPPTCSISATPAPRPACSRASWPASPSPAS